MSAGTFLNPWLTFYEVTGSSAAALTGLMFVVITIVTGTERLERSRDGVETFSTPTVTHFGTALLVSAIFCAPWRSLVPVADVTALIGLLSIVNTLRVAFRARRLRGYIPDVEDWAWYTVLPFIAYAALLFAAVVLPIVPADALFGVAGGVLLLIFIGIRNAWDVVTFLATGGLTESMNGSSRTTTSSEKPDTTRETPH